MSTLVKSKNFAVSGCIVPKDANTSGTKSHPAARDGSSCKRRFSLASLCSFERTVVLLRTSAAVTVSCTVTSVVTHRGTPACRSVAW